MSIRSAAKAIILNESRVLLNKCHDEYNGAYYSLPGGGQNTYETLHEAVIRECLEETGYPIIPKKFVALFEEICEDTKVREFYPEYAHKMYHIFLCELAHDTVKIPTEIDTMQVGIEWVPIEDLDKVHFLPDVLNGNIIKLIRGQVPMFLGSEHVQHGHG